MRTIYRLAATAIWALTAFAVSVPPTMAQFRDFREEIPQHLLRPSRTIAGDRVAFCVNVTSMMADFDRAVAAELAGALLLDHEIVEVRPLTPSPPYDFRLPLIEGEIYLFLAHECDAFMGFTQAADYSDWLRATPPYLATHTALAVREGEFTSASQFGPGQRVGARLLSIADGYLSTYLRAQPDAARWERVVYPNNAFLIERLLDESVDAILVWEPALHRYLADHPEAENVTVLTELPFTIAPTEFVISMRSENDFLQLNLAQAIAELQAEGTIDRLAAEHGLIPSP